MNRKFDLVMSLMELKIIREVGYSVVFDDATIIPKNTITNVSIM